MHTVFKKIVMVFATVFSLPSLAFAIEHREIAPKVDSDTAENSFDEAVLGGLLPDAYYAKMKEIGFQSVDDIYLPENREIRSRFVKAWKMDLDEEILMASSHVSRIGTGGKVL